MSPQHWFFCRIQMLAILKRALNLTRHRLYVVCETYNCLPDPFQILAGTTIGNKGMKILDYGKMAATVSKRASVGSGTKAIRIMLDPAKPHDCTRGL